MILIDTHCHIHEADFPIPVDDVFDLAKNAKVEKIFLVGTGSESSISAVKMANERKNCFAIVGIHPHDAEIELKNGAPEKIEKLLKTNKNIIGIGEIGLDYYYNNSPHKSQKILLKKQLDLAKKYDLPVSFHVRDTPDNTGEVWTDFWEIYNDYNVRGVLHSFTDTVETLQKALEKGLYIGVNGIATYSDHSEKQKTMWRAVPLEKILLETDAPFLTPNPYRGQKNHPANVKLVAEYLADFYDVPFEKIAEITTKNTEDLFL